MTICQRETAEASVACFNQLAANITGMVMLVLLATMIMLLWVLLLVAIYEVVFNG